MSEKRAWKPLNELMASRPSPSMVVALIALFVACCGSAFAAGGAQIPPRNSIGAAQLKNGAVTTPKIKPDAVTSTALAPKAVTAPAIGPKAVLALALAPKAVTTTALAPGAVTASNVAPGAITSTELAPNAVEAPNIRPGAVTSAKIPAGAITSTELASGAVTGPKIGPAAVGTSELAPGSVLASKIQNSAVGTQQLSNAIPSSSASKGTDTTFTNGNFTALHFPTETYDTAGLHGGAVADYRMKAPVAGIYQITVVVTWAGDNCGGKRSLEFDGRRADDSTPFLPTPFISSTVPANGSSTTTTQSLTGLMQLAAGESVEIWGGASSMSCATTTALGSPGQSLSMSWIAPGP